MQSHKVRKILEYHSPKKHLSSEKLSYLLLSFLFYLFRDKIMKHKWLNIPINIIQRTQEQTKHPQFPILCQKDYQMMKSQKV